MLALVPLVNTRLKMPSIDHYFSERGGQFFKKISAKQTLLKIKSCNKNKIKSCNKMVQ